METLVFDASVLLNFGHRGELEFLLAKFGKRYRLVVPRGVRGELLDPETKDYYDRLIRQHFTGEPPDSASINLAELKRLTAALGGGELSVMLLCLRMKGVAVLDDKQARCEARRLGIRVMGTLGLLAEASHLGWCSDAECLGFLKKLLTNRFRAPALNEDCTFADYVKGLGDE